MTTSNEHNNAPAVQQGWKLVPVEPTRAMWAAVNKLDDEMAAGSYDGKGCSIEQAWNCMLDFAPDAPALEATPAPAPAQDEPLGHFRVEPFGWTDCAATDDGAIALYEHPMTNPWRDAVIEQLESWHIYVPAIHDNSPRLAIKALVNMECKAALDPAVSSEAAALAAQGVQAPAPAQLTDEERADMACAVAAICTGASSRTVAATAIEWTERALRAKGGK